MQTLSQDELDRLKFWHLIGVFQPLPVSMVIDSPHLSPVSLALNSRKKKPSQNLSVFPLWPEDPSHSDSSLSSGFSWKDKSSNKKSHLKNEDHHLFFGFLPKDFLSRLLSNFPISSSSTDPLNSSGIAYESSGDFGASEFLPVKPQSAIFLEPEKEQDIKEELKQEIALGWMSVDSYGYCQEVRISPLFFALVSLSRKAANPDEKMSWDSLTWEKNAIDEAFRILQECRRETAKIPFPLVEISQFRSILLRWSDLLQGLKPIGPFPFFQDKLLMQSGKELVKPSLVTPSENLLADFLKSLLEGESVSPALFGFLSKQSSLEESSTQDLIHPQKAALGCLPGCSLNLNNQTLYSKIIEQTKGNGFFQVNRPLGSSTLPVLGEVLAQGVVERAIRLSVLSDPLLGLSPLEPVEGSPRLPMDALIEGGLVALVEDGSSILCLDELKENGLILNQAPISLQSWLEGGASFEFSLAVDWKIAQKRFSDALETVKNHLRDFTQKINWFNEWNQVSHREIELKKEYEEKESEVAHLRIEHREHFEALRESYQQSRQVIGVLEKDLTRFSTQVIQAKEKLSQPVEIPGWQHLLAGIGIKTPWFRSHTEKRATRMRQLKTAREDRDRCRIRVDKMKKQSRRTMKEIEDLKIFHIEQQENIDLFLANLEREKDDLKMKSEKLERQRQNSFSEIESEWKRIQSKSLDVSSTVPWLSLPSGVGKSWQLAREELFKSSIVLHHSAISIWSESFKDLLPWFDKLLREPKTLSPLVAEKLWNTLGLWIPLQVFSSQEAIRCLSSLQKSSVGWMWIESDPLAESVLPCLFQLSRQAVYVTDPTQYIPSRPTTDILKKITGFGLNPLSVSSKMSIEIQEKSISPFFEWANDKIYQNQLISVPPEGYVLESGNKVISAWIVVNSRTRARHLSHGLVDELAWLRRKVKEWKKEWPWVEEQKNGSTATRPASIRILVLNGEHAQLCQELFDELRLNGPIDIAVPTTKPAKADWVIALLGDVLNKEAFGYWVKEGAMWKACLTHPVYALSLVGFNETWGAFPEFSNLATLPIHQEKCVISSALKTRLGLVHEPSSHPDSENSDLTLDAQELSFQDTGDKAKELETVPEPFIELASDEPLDEAVESVMTKEVAENLIEMIDSEWLSPTAVEEPAVEDPVLEEPVLEEPVLEEPVSPLKEIIPAPKSVEISTDNEKAPSSAEDFSDLFSGLEDEGWDHLEKLESPPSSSEKKEKNIDLGTSIPDSEKSKKD